MQRIEGCFITLTSAVLTVAAVAYVAAYWLSAGVFHLFHYR